MADLENPGDGGDLAATPEPDDLSSLGLPCVGAFCTCTILAVSGVLIYLYSRAAHAPVAVQLLAAVGLIFGCGGIALGALCCMVAVDFCIHGNSNGERQAEVAHARM
jgi:hypothetical protein